MKSSKFLGGLVVVTVLLSGTAVLYLAGVDRGGVSKALGQPVPPPLGPPGDEDCPPGAFCGTLIGQAGGCTNIPCCPPEQAYCGTYEHVGSPFLKVKSDPKGSCWKFKDGEPQEWCRYVVCTGTVCPSSCAGTATYDIVYKTEPEQVGGSCLPKK